MKKGFLTLMLSMFLLLAMNDGFGQSTKGVSTKATAHGARVMTNDVYDSFDINNIVLWFSNNGSMGHNPVTEESGLDWPMGAGTTAMFQEGLVFGGKINGKAYVGGSSYRQGLQAGVINVDGTTEPSNPRFRIYKACNIRQADYDTMTAGEKARLRNDFMMWPVADGAPFIDSDHNGMYNPNFDAWLADSSQSDKPWFVGDEVMWFVSNDLDASRTGALYGSSPMHLEIRTMIWGYRSGGPLRNAVYVKHTLINKGSNDIDDFYVAKWADPDLGNMFDDLVGIDTLSGMGFIYNGRTNDSLYGIPPALGTILVQGPVVPSPGTVARWNFSERSGYRNLPVTGFSFYVNANSIYTDPDLGTPGGTFAMYDNMRGLLSSGKPCIDPVTLLPVKMALAGDPLTGQGWIDGLVHPPGDRRMLTTSGPCTLARGDTQEVVFATLISLGTTNLKSVEELMKDAAILKGWFNFLPARLEPPTTTCHVIYPGPNAARVELTGGSHTATVLTGVIRSRTGVLVAEFPLYDDGQHGDGGASDGVFGGAWDVGRQLDGVDCHLRCTFASGQTQEWLAGHCLPLAGPVRNALHKIESDHLNYDGIANPGENIRMSVELDNQTSFDIGQWKITPELNTTDLIQRMSMPAVIPAHQKGYMPYTAGDASTFIVYDVPPTAIDGQVCPIPTIIADVNYNIWRDMLYVPVSSFSTPPTDSLMIHVAGPATGKFGWRVATPGALHNHTYVVTMSGQNLPGETEGLEDLIINDFTAQNLLFREALFPDRYAHEMPVTDGWKATQGTAAYHYALDTAYIPPEHHWLRVQNEWQMARNSWGSALTCFDLVPVRIVFNTTLTQKAYCYLRGGIPNFGYVGYYDVPMRAFDVSDPANPRQINLAFVEQKDGPAQDQTWMPGTDPLVDREMLFVLKSTYSPTPDPLYTPLKLNVDADKMDIMYSSWLFRESATATFKDGDYYQLTPTIPVSYRDTFMVNPLGVINEIRKPRISEGFALGQNYPNPFGVGSCTTFIPVELRQRAHATLRVHDMLGRPVLTVFDGMLDAGRHDLPFTAPSSLPAGMYSAVLMIDGVRTTMRMTVMR